MGRSLRSVMGVAVALAVLAGAVAAQQDAATWRRSERQRASVAGDRSPQSERPPGATKAKSGEPPAAAEAQAAAVAAGAALFSGTTPLAHRGPPCLACHSAAGLPFPNGGTLGPNLTRAYTRMGAQGIETALTTLYFPAMYPLYRTRPLTPGERADLAAFLQSSASQPPPHDTGPVAGLGIVLFVIFMLIIAYVGRNRLRGVRRQLVERARASARGGGQ